MNIAIKTIPHNDQQYETCGNWWFDGDGNIEIRVSDTGNWKYEVLVAVHEILEVCLCKDRGIDPRAVDAFDAQYEKERLEGKHADSDEPGDDPAAPYQKEHRFATALEMLFAQQLGVDWLEYEKTIVALKQTK